MTTATLHNTIIDPAGRPRADVRVTIRLLASLVGDAPGYVTGGAEAIRGTWHITTGLDGRWALDIETVDAISPAGAVYEIFEDIAPNPQPYWVTPLSSSGAVIWVGDVLTIAPLAVTTPTSATAVSFTPAAGLTSTNIQAAVLELAALITGLDVKGSARVATTGNHALIGLANVDGTTISDGDRILARAQTAPAENGIYVAHSGVWTRTEDANTSAEVTPGLIVYTERGTTFGDQLWTLATDSPIVLGTTALTFQPLSGGGATVSSVNSRTGVVVGLAEATDLAAETAARIAAAAAHVAAVDPHGDRAHADAGDALRIPLTQRGVADGVATLDSGGLIPAAQLPAIAISDTSVVASQAAMLALTAQVGDVAVRTDLNKSFILKTAPATILANWQELLTPTDAVSSVNGRNGSVTGLAEATDLAAETAARIAADATKQPLAAALTTLATATPAGLALMDDANAAAQRVTLGLGDTAVTPGTYGSASQIPIFVVDQLGRLTNATTAAIADSPAALILTRQQFR